MGSWRDLCHHGMQVVIYFCCDCCVLKPNFTTDVELENWRFVAATVSCSTRFLAARTTANFVAAMLSCSKRFVAVRMPCSTRSVAVTASWSPLRGACVSSERWCLLYVEPVCVSSERWSLYVEPVCVSSERWSLLYVEPVCVSSERRSLYVEPVCVSSERWYLLYVEPVCVSSERWSLLYVEPVCVSSERWSLLYVEPVCVSSERREDGAGRDRADGGHGAVLGGAASGDASSLVRQRSAGVLRTLQRVPAQRLRQIVSAAARRQGAPPGELHVRHLSQDRAVFLVAGRCFLFCDFFF